MDETATAACTPSPATSAGASAPPAPPRALKPDATASTEVSTPVVAAATPSSAARRPPLGRPRTVAARPRGIGQPRRQQTPPASAATTDDSDDGGSGDVGVASGRNCCTRAQALQEFLTCVAAEITELVAAFQAQSSDTRCFTTFKALWLEHRLSAVFQVEFWDSTPSDTHHAILQVALELLEDAVHTPTQEDDASVWKVIGFWFALYCAFCVQVSEPKIKIAVDVVAWQTLTQLSALLTLRLTVPRFADAAREALAMLRRLEHEEDAFLKCLGGAVTEFRLKPRSRQRPAVGTVGPTPTAPLALPPRREEAMEDVVLRLEALSAQYNSALKQLAHLETSAVDATSSSVTAATSQGGRGGGANRGRGRGRATPTFLRKTRPSEVANGTTSGSGSSFLQEAGLWGDQKATEHELWVTRLRQSLFPSSVNAADHHNPSDGIVRRRRPSQGQAPMFADDQETTDDVDAALLALEQELEREEAGALTTLNAKPPASRRSTATQRRPPTAQRKSNDAATVSQPTRASVVASSGQESDGLDELEAELARDVAGGTVPAITRSSAPKRAAPSARTPPARSRARVPSVLSVDTESDGLAELEAELERDTRPPTKPVGVPPSRSIVPRATRSRAMSIASTAEESDGLEELEAELTRETRPGGILTKRTDTTATESIATRVPRMTRSRAMSIVSTGEETDGLDELEAELSRDAAATQVPRASASASRSDVPIPAVARAPTGVTRKRAFSIVSSGQESDGLAELEAELGQDPHVIAEQPAPRPRNHKHQQAATQAKGPHAPVRQQPASRPPRAQPRRSSRFSDVSSVDELNLLQQELDASVSASLVLPPATRLPVPSRKRHAMASSTPSAPPAKRLATTSSSVNGTPTTTVPAQTLPTRRSRRLSDASSAMTESDAELAALQAELAATPTLTAAERTTMALNKQTSSRAKTASRLQLRSMSELSEVTESDEDLKELQAELAKTAQVAVATELVKKPKANAKAKTSNATSKSKEPRKRASTTVAKVKTVVASAAVPPTAEKLIQKPKPTRKPRQPKTTAKPTVQQGERVASMQKPPPIAASAVPSTSTRLSSRRSVASSYDSDGLDELENELRAFQ